MTLKLISRVLEARLLLFLEFQNTEIWNNWTTSAENKNVLQLYWARKELVQVQKLLKNKEFIFFSLFSIPFHAFSFSFNECVFFLYLSRNWWYSKFRLFMCSLLLTTAVQKWDLSPAFSPQGNQSLGHNIRIWEN